MLVTVRAGEFEFFHGAFAFIPLCESTTKMGSKTFHSQLDTFLTSIPHVWGGQTYTTQNKPTGIMKIKNLQMALSLACALCFLVGNYIALAEATNTTANVPPTAANDDLGSDFYNGKAYKIVSVVAVTPTHVQVRYDGNFGGRKIPRMDLSPQLAAKYPYDAAKAAEYQKQQAELIAQQQAAQRAAARAALEQRERTITAEIARLEEEERNLTNKQTINKSLTRGERRRNKVADNAAEREKIADRIASLRKQLVTIRAQKDSLP
jgi:hypothetical protein